jgi:hypothetical protein
MSFTIEADTAQALSRAQAAITLKVPGTVSGRRSIPLSMLNQEASSLEREDCGYEPEPGCGAETARIQRWRRDRR